MRLAADFTLLEEIDPLKGTETHPFLHFFQNCFLILEEIDPLKGTETKYASL